MNENDWTEERILSYEDESFYFERKGGKLIESGGGKDDLAKEVCAFANSQGGAIALGVENDGTPTGIDEKTGNKTTNEWIGNILKNALVPKFQRFHVKPVTPSTHTKIPEGKILLVIDVEKSDNAPHQAIHNGVYYHRVDKESLPAPHDYILGLLARQTFPGPNVGRAWIQFVINPAISSLENEQQLLQDKCWGSISPSRASLHCFKLLDTSKERPNMEQFFTEHNEICDLVKEHDRYGQALVEIAGSMFWEIERLALEDQLFEQFTSLEMLMRLKADPIANVNRIFDHCVERNDFLKILRIEDDAKISTKHFIANLFENRISENSNFSSLLQVNWCIYRQFFENTFHEQLYIIDSSAKEFSSVVGSLTILLRKERDLLCRKYGLPYDPSETH